ncbi:glycine zipper 2TM domain-containing protein [Motiliproteus sediminis]|uniref:glycine zipper 2TM domain-containing protein n=1 Tax=Motiliproteus sediminis TaxID=1468178 RepID=UPI001AF02932|nr:glycine zipper 2TM domain-containing protein [Motiliproteus sediminis]
MNRLHYLVLAAALPLTLSGCLSNPTNLQQDTYSAAEAQRATSIQRGVILTVEEVAVKDGGTAGGQLVGAIIGAGLGHQVGGGSGQDWATAGGALVGGMVGDKATSYNEKAFAYIVELRNGRTVQVVQQGAQMLPNTPVFVKYLSGGRAVLQLDTSQQQIYDRTHETQYRD